MQIVVTGGCGYVASNLLPALSPFADRIDFIDVKKPTLELQRRLNTKQYSYIQLDLTDETKVRKVISRYDFIIHLAALVGYPACQKHPDLAEKSNVKTTETIIRTMGKKARLLFASTTSNYGDQINLVDEGTPAKPNSLYGTTKMHAENLVQELDEFTIYRFAGAFGCAPIMRHDNLIHDFICRAINGEFLEIYESHFIRQFIHIQDMANSIVFAIQHWDRVRGNLFNVGNPQIEITKKEIVQRIARVFPFPFRLEGVGADLEKRNYRVSFEKILKAGFQPQKHLDEGIRELIDYYSGEMRRGVVNG